MLIAYFQKKKKKNMCLLVETIKVEHFPCIGIFTFGTRYSFLNESQWKEWLKEDQD
jgi:hypothetical protein